MQWHFANTCERRFRHSKLSQDGHEAYKEFGLSTLTASLWKISCVKGGEGGRAGTLWSVSSRVRYMWHNMIHPLLCIHELSGRSSSLFFSLRGQWFHGADPGLNYAWPALRHSTLLVHQADLAQRRLFCVFRCVLRSINVSERCADHVKGWSDVCVCNESQVSKLKILAKKARWEWNATKDVRWICTISEDTS